MNTSSLIRGLGRVVVLGALIPLAASAQDTLTLRSALALGAEHAVPNRIARAAVDEANAARLATWRSVLPSARIEAGFVRTTDPVGAFGTALRQQRIAPADFDPQRLNFPAPTNNFSGAFVVEQPLIIADGWIAARSATRGAASAAMSAEWSTVNTEARIIDAWFGVIVASERARTMHAALRAAEGHARQAELMLKAGLVTKSDLLLARARAGELEALRLESERDAIIARRQLGALVGLSSGEPVVQGGFPSDSTLERRAGELDDLGLRPRADVEAARLAHGAASADVQRATASMLPKLFSFARRDLNSSDQPFGGASNWSVGIMASWPLFTGAAELADRQATQARQSTARAQLTGAEANAAVEHERSALTLHTAKMRLAIARRNLDYSAEAHRIVEKKYAGGLATVLELLDAAAAELQSGLQLTAARQALISAMADRLRTAGHAPSRLADLDAPAPEPTR